MNTERFPIKLSSAQVADIGQVADAFHNVSQALYKVADIGQVADAFHNVAQALYKVRNTCTFTEGDAKHLEATFNALENSGALEQTES